MGKAGQRCRTCDHPELVRIEMMLARGISPLRVARRFSLEKDSVYRHKKNHLSPALKAAAVYEREALNVDLDKLRHDESEKLLQRLVAFNGRLLALVNIAEELGDYEGAARLWGRLLEAWKLEAQFLGELGLNTKTIVQNLVISPQWVHLRGALISALRPYPEAGRAVAEVLRKLELPEELPPMIEARANGAIHAGA